MKTEDKELWKQVSGYEGFYEISSLGNVNHIKSGSLKYGLRENLNFLGILMMKKKLI